MTDKILYINACIREESRTDELARCLLRHLEGEVTEARLEQRGLMPLTVEDLEKRDEGQSKEDFSDTIFDSAKEFRDADIIVLAAPYWDLSFPSLVKIYFEHVTIHGLTFYYNEEGKSQGLCNAKKLYYVRTAGGPIVGNDHGFSYVKDLATEFYGIDNVELISAEMLDVDGADVEGILKNTKEKIEKTFEKNSD